ncbi:MAG: type II secretion system protein [Xenococcaceae cyanobacterium MO_188.B29]|nr:type II secretion system protein [Xenococcaceae cyanobacterium MO_188.B29]
MQRYNVRNQNKGFTLTEMIVTVIVAGVIAAITAPSLVGWFNRNQINEAQRQVESALKEAQRQAIRRGKSCSVKINTTNNTISISDSSYDNGCLLSQRNVGESTLVGGDTVSLKANSNPVTISFTHKGNTSSQEVIVIESSLSSAKKCVAIAEGIGRIKTGTYTGNLNTTLTRDSCSSAN